MDVGQCEFIQHLIDMTETVATSSLPEKSSPKKGSRKLEPSYSNASEKNNSLDYDSRLTSRNTSPVSSGHDLLSSRDSQLHDDWHTDLPGCSSEPYLCMSSEPLI
uniref:Uncharacterized protein MANES_02G108200 n=1 Tax=Rhizophora mucronata TaxID=61149 RepID=A0A2P2Q5E3_RHIMU